MSSYFSRRQGCSYGFAIAVGVTVVVVDVTHPPTDWMLATVNIVLTVLAAAYRVLNGLKNTKKSANSGWNAEGVGDHRISRSIIKRIRVL